MNTDELYIAVQLACEAIIANTATSDEKLLVETYPEIFLSTLKTKKKDIEYQFSSHKVLMHEFHVDYMCGTLTKKEYFTAILEEKTWRAKAVSYLTRVDNKIVEVKAKLKLCNHNKTEKGSSQV